MDSALTPREIQSRTRSGEALADIARAAGVTTEEIEAYAAPILAERHHVAELARAAQVRRAGEASSGRLLGAAVADRLSAQGIDPDSVRWDAWRGESRTWTVLASYVQGSEPREATFAFDQRGRFSHAVNDVARDLIADGSGPASMASGRRPGTDPDNEPTVDLNDELALVRVVQDDVRLTTDRQTKLVEPEATDPVADQSDATQEGEAGEEANLGALGEIELEEVDGIYEIVANPRSEMDVLYDMLASFNEDSVNIYAGLNQPVSTEAADGLAESATSTPEEPQAETAPEPEPEAEPEAEAEPESEAAVEPEPEAAPQPEPEPQSEPEPQAAAPESDTDEPEAEADADADAQDDESAPPAASEPEPQPKPVLTEPEQDSLLDPEAEPTRAIPKPTGQKRPSKRKRASVPTWDEIMFGSPRTEH